MSPPAMSKLILASASPRRLELLTQLGLPFTVEAANIDESQLPGETPYDYVYRLALLKAQRVAQRQPHAVVIGADTIVTIDGDILGKPDHEAMAQQMLRRLSGRRHAVMTGLAIVQHDTNMVQRDVVSTDIQFRVLSDAEIDAYIATSEPLDKAGAYAIQDAGGRFVDHYDGCYTNVVGLPVQRTAALLRAAGLNIPPALDYGTGA